MQEQPATMSGRAGRNSPLVVHLAMRYRDRLPANLPWADFLQEGEIGLAQAVRKFDPSKGRKFEAFASPWILGCLKGAFKAATRNPFGMTFDAENVPAPEPDREAERLADEVWSAVEGLDAVAREAVIRRWGLDGFPPESQEVTAWNMGLQVRNVRRIVRDAKASMAASMAVAT